MPENPIPAIESAELAAKRTVQKANEDKAAIISAAKEKAERDLAIAVEKAQSEEKRIIQAAERATRDKVAELDSAFEKVKADTASNAEKNESAAICAVMELIGARNV